jgi:hypothetical protein
VFRRTLRHVTPSSSAKDGASAMSRYTCVSSCAKLTIATLAMLTSYLSRLEQTAHWHLEWRLPPSTMDATMSTRASLGLVCSCEHTFEMIITATSGFTYRLAKIMSLHTLFGILSDPEERYGTNENDHHDLSIDERLPRNSKPQQPPTLRLFGSVPSPWRMVR